MTPRLPRSTFGLATLVSVALSIATIALGVVVYFVSHEALEKQLDHRIAAETHHLEGTAAEQGIGALIAAIVRREDGHSTNGMGYMLFSPAGRKVAGKLNASLAAAGWHELLPLADARDGAGDVAQALVTPVRDGYVLVVAADRTAIDEIDRTILEMFAAAFGTMLLVGIGCSSALGLVVRRRLERINATAEAIIDGDISRRMMRDDMPNEFDRLAETLNRMLDRNQQLLDNLRQVSSDIAHDLRTPLARQKQVLEAALAQELDAEACRETIRKAAEAGQEILDIFAALLRISEIETYQIRETFQPVDLSEVIERVADAFQADAEASGHPLRLEIDRGVRVAGDRHLLAQMLANLVENALLHTPSGTTVQITLSHQAGSMMCSVSDNGPGVAPAEHDRILKRFVRLDASRSTPGHGLGMSLVAAIARAHHAEVSLEDNAPGFRVTIRFEGLQPVLDGAAGE